MIFVFQSRLKFGGLRKLWPCMVHTNLESIANFTEKDVYLLCSNVLMRH